MKFDPKKLKALPVRLFGKQIGVINRLAGDRQFFAFEQDYIDDPRRPTLSLSFKGRTGGLVTNLRPVGRRVPVFFSNLLPEGHLRDYLAKRADVNPDREFLLLAYSTQRTSASNGPRLVLRWAWAVSSQWKAGRTIRGMKV